MLPPKHGLATRMLYHACEFSESADLLLSKDHHETSGVCERYCSPGVVCLSLACEIYIKTLLISSNVPLSKTHELDKLFKALPDELKERIKTVSQIEIDADFIKEFSNTFTIRRYFYESDEHISFLSIGKLIALRNVLRNESCKAVHSTTWDDYRKKMRW